MESLQAGLTRRHSGLYTELLQMLQLYGGYSTHGNHSVTSRYVGGSIYMCGPYSALCVPPVKNRLV